MDGEEKKYEIYNHNRDMGGMKMDRKDSYKGCCGLVFSKASETGFTIIELLIAMSVASLVAMSGFALFNQSNASFQTQENVGEAQQNARVAMDRISRDIRTAGFGLPTPPYTLSYAGASFSNPVTVGDSSTGPDTITILGIGYEEGQIIEGENDKGQGFICYSSINRTTDNPFGRILDKTSKYVTYARRYINVEGVYFAELDTSAPYEECGGSTRMKLPLLDPPKLKGDFNSGTVYIIQAVEYSIVETNEIGGCSALNPCLVSKDYSMLRGSAGANVGRELLAENIEDLQFAYGIDKDDNGIDFTTAYVSGAYIDDPTATQAKDISAVRVNIVARTRQEDLKKTYTGKKPAVENRPEGSANDSYRRRILSKVIKIRN